VMVVTQTTSVVGTTVTGSLDLAPRQTVQLRVARRVHHMGFLVEDRSACRSPVLVSGSHMLTSRRTVADDVGTPALAGDDAQPSRTSDDRLPLLNRSVRERCPVLAVLVEGASPGRCRRHGGCKGLRSSPALAGHQPSTERE